MLKKQFVCLCDGVGKPVILSPPIWIEVELGCDSSGFQVLTNPFAANIWFNPWLVNFKVVLKMEMLERYQYLKILWRDKPFTLVREKSVHCHWVLQTELCASFFFSPHTETLLSEGVVLRLGIFACSPELANDWDCALQMKVYTAIHCPLLYI